MGIGNAGIGGLGIGGLGIGGSGVGNISIPFGALAYYNYTLTPYFVAIREQVNKDADLLVLNASNTADLVAGGVDVASSDDASIVNYTTKGVLVKSDCVAGDFDNASLWINGLNTSLNTMTFLQSGGNSGTFAAQAVSDFIGTPIRSNGFEIRISGIENTYNIFYEGLNGITDQQVQDNFEYPNVLEFDFSRSGYAPDDVAGLITLREAATPPDSGLSDDTVRWATTDFSLTIPFQFDSGGTDGRIAVCGTGFDLHYDDGNGRYELITALGTVVSGAISPSSGNEITIEVQVDSSSGATLIVNGTAGTTNAAVTAVTWTASTMRYMNNLAGTAETAAIVHETTFKPL